MPPHCDTFDGRITRIVTMPIMVLLLILGGACTQKAPGLLTHASIRIIFDTEKTEDWGDYPGEFIPDIAHVDKGTNVTWTNNDIKEHTLISDNGLFNQQLAPGANFSYTFQAAGNFTYHCDRYNMTACWDMPGWVIVE